MVKCVSCGVLWLEGDGASGRSGQSAKIFQVPEVPLSAQSAIATTTRSVTAAAGVYAPGHLGELTRYLPFELVDDVLEQTRTVQRRLRALPSRTGVYFLLALAMFPRLGYARVWGKLTAGLVGLDVPSPETGLVKIIGGVGQTPSDLAFPVSAPGRTRTCDRLLRRQLLYPAELQALRLNCARTRPGARPAPPDRPGLAYRDVP
jgi:hypothetical protein